MTEFAKGGIIPPDSDTADQIKRIHGVGGDWAPIDPVQQARDYGDVSERVR
jgi:hypothetical protein